MEELNILNQMDVRRAAALLLQGGIGAMPTETVYGLAADATQLRAVARVFEVKERPVFDPLIVHVAGIREAREVAAEISAEAERLMQAFWPGPLTIVLTKKEIIPDLVTAGLPTVAIRCPKHEGALALIKALGRPIAAPSANRYGRTSPTTMTAAIKELGDRMDFALDGGPCEVGVESTIVRIVNGEVEILRPGGVSAEDIRAVIPTVRYAKRIQESGEVFPGSGARHYATTTPLLYPEEPLEKTIGALEALYTKIKTRTKRGAQPSWPRIGFLAFGPVMDSPVFAEQISLSEKKSVTEAASRLFAAMRVLDEAKLDWMIAEKFEGNGLAYAIDDRLTRASAAVTVEPIFESLGEAVGTVRQRAANRRSGRAVSAASAKMTLKSAGESEAAPVTTITRRSASRPVSSRGNTVETNQEQMPFESDRLTNETTDKPKRGRPVRGAKKRRGAPSRPAFAEADEAGEPLEESDAPNELELGASKGGNRPLPVEDDEEEGDEEAGGQDRWQDDENADDPEDNGPRGGGESGDGNKEVDEDSQQKFFAKRGDSLHTARRQRDRDGRSDGGRPNRGRGFGGGGGRPSFGNRGNRPHWQDRGNRRFGRGPQQGGHSQGQEGRPFRPQGDFQGGQGDQGGRPFRPQQGGGFRGRGNFGDRPYGQGQGQGGNFGRHRGGFRPRGPQGGPGQGGFGGGFRPRQGGWRDNPQGGEGGYRGGFGGQQRPHWQGGQGQEGYRGGQGGGFRPRSNWQNPRQGGGQDRFRGPGQGGRQRPFGRHRGPGGFRGGRPDGGFRPRPEERSGGGSEE